MIEPNYFEAATKLTTKKVSGIVDDIDSYIFEDENPPTKKQIEDKYAEMKAEWDAQEYARKRQVEYPTIAELTVALYDTDDKSAVEAKRAAVKLKYPKP